MARVLLRAQPNDTEGVHVRAEILKVVSSVFDGIIDSHASDAAEGADAPVLTLDCTTEELNSFVACISTPASGSKGSFAEVDELSILLKHGTRAMRCLDKYDANGILRTLDLMSECLAKASLSSSSALAPMHEKTLSDYFDARLAILPDDTDASVIPETVYRFITAHITATLASVKELRIPERGQKPYRDSRLLFDGDNEMDFQAHHATEVDALRQAIHFETATFPPKIKAEVLMRVMIYTLNLMRC